MMNITRVVIHCSASPQGRGDDAETIHSWHTRRGWSGIGYHYVILEDGTLQTGRPEYWEGAHVNGHNKDSLGICLIGYGSEVTNDQMDTLAQLLLGLNHKYNGVEVLGHNDLDPNKTCPNFNVKEWWGTIL